MDEELKNSGLEIREKIIDFMKSHGYSHAEGEKEFNDETSDMFARDNTLVEVTITVGIDNEVIKQIMGQEK